MKVKEFEQMHVIHEQNAADYMRAVNELLVLYPDVTIDRDMTTPFLSYHIIRQCVAIPETIAERYETAGMGQTCACCPVMGQNQIKGNQKIYPCKYAKYGKAYRDGGACDRFYKFHGKFGEFTDFEKWAELSGGIYPDWVRFEFEKGVKKCNI